MDFKKAEKIQLLNAMFHEFNIEKLEYTSNSLVIKTILPWAKLWGDENYTLYIKYDDCTFIDCEYYPIMDDEKIEAYPGKYIFKTEELHTSNPEIITDLSLKIFNSSFNSPNRFVFWCKSDLKIELAKIIFNADELHFFDAALSEISLDEFIIWKEKWWESKFS